MFKVCRSHFGTDAQHLQHGIVPTNVAYYTSR
jgi:hypothetical protein